MTIEELIRLCKIKLTSVEVWWNDDSENFKRMAREDAQYLLDYAKTLENALMMEQEGSEE